MHTGGSLCPFCLYPTPSPHILNVLYQQLQGCWIFTRRKTQGATPNPFAPQQALSTPCKGIKTNCQVLSRPALDLLAAFMANCGLSTASNAFMCFCIKGSDQVLCHFRQRIPRDRPTLVSAQ